MIRTILIAISKTPSTIGLTVSFLEKDVLKEHKEFQAFDQPETGKKCECVTKTIQSFSLLTIL